MFEVKKLEWRDSSELIRYLLDKYRAEIHDEKFCKQQEQRCHEEAKQWKERRQAKSLITPKAIEVLQLWYQTYTSAHRPAVDNSKNLFWIKEKIIPALKEAGCTAFDKNQILDIFKEHHRTGKVKIEIGEES